eukprot:COSAG01_NODE_7186_length_3309_cov_30.878656_5_plen_36_part_01
MFGSRRLNMFLTEYNVRGSTVLPKQSITIAFSMDPR